MYDPTDPTAGIDGSSSGFDTSQIGSSISDGISNIITGVTNSVAVSSGGYPYGYDGYYPYGTVVVSPTPRTIGGQQIRTNAGTSGATLIIIGLVIWFLVKKG